jgi:hypothetical protein
VRIDKQDVRDGTYHGQAAARKPPFGSGQIIEERL